MYNESFSFKILDEYGIFNIISTRKWGSINPFVGYSAIKRIAEGLRIPEHEYQIASHLVFAEQIHKNNVHICRPGDESSIRLYTDALISNIPSQILGIYTADCVPILLYDPKNHIIGAIHAGYKGLEEGIILRCIKKWMKNFNSSPLDILVGIGPFIHVCCYEVKEDLIERSQKNGWISYIEKREAKLFLNLKAIVYHELQNCGILLNKIEDIEMCTSCRKDIFFSARKRTLEEERGSSIISLISLSKSVLIL